MEKLRKIPVKGIIFDLDGTLADTLPDIASSLNYALHKAGLESYPPQTIKTFIGDGIKALVEKTLQDLYQKQKISLQEKENLQGEVLQHFIDHYTENCTADTYLYEGVKEFLQENENKYRFAVLTNKAGVFTDKILKYYSVYSYFSHILSGDIEQYKKPNPDGIYKIQQDWNFSPEEILVVGDNYTDIQAAKNAGVRSVFAMYGFGKLNGINPNYSIKKFIYLKPLLKIIEG